MPIVSVTVFLRETRTLEGKASTTGRCSASRARPPARYLICSGRVADLQAGGWEPDLPPERERVLPADPAMGLPGLPGQPCARRHRSLRRRPGARHPRTEASAPRLREQRPAESRLARFSPLAAPAVAAAVPGRKGEGLSGRRKPAGGGPFPSQRRRPAVPGRLILALKTWCSYECESQNVQSV